MHNREHIVVIRPGRTGIVLHTMFYETEIRRDDEHRTDTSNVAERELELALLLVQNLAAPFEPAKYHDTYKEKLDALIAAKIEGKEPIEEPKSAAKSAGDILAALERSLALARKPAASEKLTAQPSASERSKLSDWNLVHSRAAMSADRIFQKAAGAETSAVGASWRFRKAGSRSAPISAFTSGAYGRIPAFCASRLLPGTRESAPRAERIQSQHTSP